MKDTNETIIVVDHCIHIEPEKGKNERKLEVILSQEMKNVAMMEMIKGIISDYGRDSKVSREKGEIEKYVDNSRVSAEIDLFTYHSASSFEIMAHLDCETVSNEASKKFTISIYDLDMASHIFNEFDKISIDSVSAYLKSKGAGK